jgi:hypothetical protein
MIPDKQEMVIETGRNLHLIKRERLGRVLE